MIAVARTVRAHPREVARTLRETYGVGLSDQGDGLTWGEAKILLDEASADPATVLGAHLAGWAYPASIPQLLSIVVASDSPKATKRIMPWALTIPGRSQQHTDPEEVSAAHAELEGGIVFASD